MGGLQGAREGGCFPIPGGPAAVLLEGEDRTFELVPLTWATTWCGANADDFDAGPWTTRTNWLRGARSLSRRAPTSGYTHDSVTRR